MTKAKRCPFCNSEMVDSVRNFLDIKLPVLIHEDLNNGCVINRLQISKEALELWNRRAGIVADLANCPFCNVPMKRVYVPATETYQIAHGQTDCVLDGFNFTDLYSNIIDWNRRDYDYAFEDEEDESENEEREG